MDKNYIVSTDELAEIFKVSARQIQYFVQYGIIEPVDLKSKAFKFDLFTVVPQYCTFLSSKIPMNHWTMDVR